MTNSPGLLIAFDGLDSSGKQTQAQQLAARLRYQGLVVREWQTPDYSTPSGQELKRRLQNKAGEWGRLPWEDKMKLFAANRVEHKDDVLAALGRGEIIIYDRYVASSLAFITVEALAMEVVDLWRDKVQTIVARHEYEALGMPHEDLSIFLDVPPLVSVSLLEKRKVLQQDDHEYTDHLDVQQRLYNEYDVLCQRDPRRFFRVGCVAGEELLPVDGVAELVWEGVAVNFPQLKVHGS